MPAAERGEPAAARRDRPLAGGFLLLLLQMLLVVARASRFCGPLRARNRWFPIEG